MYERTSERIWSILKIWHNSGNVVLMGGHYIQRDVLRPTHYLFSVYSGSGFNQLMDMGFNGVFSGSHFKYLKSTRGPGIRSTFRPTKFKFHYVAPQYLIFRRTV